MIGIVSYRELEFYDSIRPVSNKGNWFLILLGNPHNPTPALKLVLENYIYLNRRTKDVRFFMPGFVVDREGIHARIRMCLHDSFSFYEDGFLDTIDWLENGTEKYEYSESMELILLPFSKDENNGIVCDFDNLLCYNLDQMLKEGKNIIKCITNAVQVIYQDMSVEETARQMGDMKNKQSLQDTHTVFIAGSKDLWRERDSIRAIFSQLSNRGHVWYKTYTFEDFDRSFTINGRQDDYNFFIREEADSALFILDDRIGGITRHEFQIAIDSFVTEGHPHIFVYSRKADGEQDNHDIQEIRDVINNYNQYYTEYIDIQDLRNQIIRDFR